MTDPRCASCVFWRDMRCTHTYSLRFIIEPTGGTVLIDFTPGMMPDVVKEDAEIFFGNLVDMITKVIDRAPFWEKVREWQENNPECQECPGRSPACHLKLVKH